MKPAIIIPAITVAPGAAMAWLGDKLDIVELVYAGTAIFSLFFLIMPGFVIYSKLKK